MKSAVAITQNEQLHMPGMSTSTPHNTDRHNVCAGQEVLYMGKISGGPRYGERGVVVKTFERRVMVNMGHSGTWHIPYYYVTAPLRAA